ncbi:hypothetical protein ACLOJK_003940 [Asimina triloba]
MMKRFNTDTGCSIQKHNVDNRFKMFRTYVKKHCMLQGISGMSWDDERHCFNATNEMWRSIHEKAVGQRQCEKSRKLPKWIEQLVHDVDDNTFIEELQRMDPQHEHYRLHEIQKSTHANPILIPLSIVPPFGDFFPKKIHQFSSNLHCSLLKLNNGTRTKNISYRKTAVSKPTKQTARSTASYSSAPERTSSRGMKRVTFKKLSASEVDTTKEFFPERTVHTTRMLDISVLDNYSSSNFSSCVLNTAIRFGNTEQEAIECLGQILDMSVDEVDISDEFRDVMIQLEANLLWKISNCKNGSLPKVMLAHIAQCADDRTNLTRPYGMWLTSVFEHFGIDLENEETEELNENAWIGKITLRRMQVNLKVVKACFRRERAMLARGDANKEGMSEMQAQNVHIPNVNETTQIEDAEVGRQLMELSNRFQSFEDNLFHHLDIMEAMMSKITTKQAEFDLRFTSSHHLLNQDRVQRHQLLRKQFLLSLALMSLPMKQMPHCSKKSCIK